MREMILADNVDDRKKALAKLLSYQKGDFVGIFKALKGFPATIRFLDPPLHKFLPHEDAAQQDLAKKMGVPVELIRQRVKVLREFNPMLGFRGCCLGIVCPKISERQARAVFEAANATNRTQSESCGFEVRGFARPCEVCDARRCAIACRWGRFAALMD